MRWILWIFVFVGRIAFMAQAANENLLINGGFESELAPAWEKRTPDDATRAIYRAENTGRSGAAVVLENREPVFTRLRQGHDRSIRIEPGRRIEFSAWIKSELDDAGGSMLQIYCMNEEGKIVTQPVSRRVSGAKDWIFCRLRTVVPVGTAYVLAYLQTQDGVGKVWFDDVTLTAQAQLEPLPPESKVALFSDLPPDHVSLRGVVALFGDRLIKVQDDPAALQHAEGALALYAGDVPEGVWPALKAFTERGGRVFMDIRAFAEIHGVAAVAIKVGDPSPKDFSKAMQAGLRVMRTDDATAGFTVGQTMPRASWPDGMLYVLPQAFKLAGMKVLAEGPDNEPGLVRLTLGTGRVTACDLLSLREPYLRNVDSICAFAPISGALGRPPALGQYYSHRFTYDGFVAEMRRLADVHPQITLEDEGEASGGYRLWSLNLGTPGKPLYFLYAAAHGSEWEPGYGLLTFAQRVAEGRLRDAVDLTKVRIKIIPLLNPDGYTRMRRQNANSVDLNRQGDWNWEHFKGRDSNKDGVWGAGDYDWKGAAPLSEPEAKVYHRISQIPDLHCILDFHANSSVKSNRIGVLPATANQDNDDLSDGFQRIARLRLRGKHLLRQQNEEFASQYLLNRLSLSRDIPTLTNTGAKGRFGLMIELTGGYRETYGTLLQTDVACELCRALFLTYPPSLSKHP